MQATASGMQATASGMQATASLIQATGSVRSGLIQSPGLSIQSIGMFLVLNKHWNSHWTHQVGCDQGTTSKDLVQVPIGPVTRARAKKFKDVLNGLIQELWAQANSWRPIGA
uniref:Uncharacterized protein n=1 Tax=Fagus sylvatica TaxID=28930 RepID=A0A2N9ILF7_FAGSY